MSGADPGARTSAPTPGGIATPRPLGPYDLLAEIGRGGMGIVYRARHRALGKIVALKAFQAGPSLGDEPVQRFQREARVVASLRHPGIVAVHDVGAAGSTHWFTMDLVEGCTLDEWVATRPPRQDVLAVLEKAARAVGHAHARGVVHRDLKPTNLMVRAGAEPMVMDFGLAKRLTGDTPDASLTQSGAVFGTPAYMAPEQASGRIREVGPGSDVYALGALLRFASTGRPPYEGESIPEVLLQILRGPPPPPRAVDPTISRELEAVILKAMARRPADRHPSAEALAEDLARLRAGAPPLAAGSDRTGARRVAIGAGLAVVLAIAGAGVAAIVRARDREPGLDERSAGPATLPGPAVSIGSELRANAEPVAAAPTAPAGRQALLASILDAARSGATPPVADLRAALRDLAWVPTAELQDWAESLAGAAATVDGTPLAASLREEETRVVEEFAARHREPFDQALAEAARARETGNHRAARARLERLRREQPLLARTAAWSVAAEQTAAAVEGAVRELEAILARAASEGSTEARAPEIEAALAGLPESDAARLRAAWDAVRAESRLATVPPAAAGDAPATPDPAPTALRRVEEALARRDLRAAAAAVEPTQDASTPANAELREVHEALLALVRVEEATRTAIAERRGGRLALGFVRPRWESFAQVRLRGLEPAPAGGEESVIFELQAGASTTRPLGGLDADSLVRLAALVPEITAGLPTWWDPLCRWVIGIDTPAGAGLLNDPAVGEGLRGWLRARLVTRGRDVLAALRDARSRADVATGAGYLWELDVLGEGLLDEAGRTEVAASRSWIEEAQGREKLRELSSRLRRMVLERRVEGCRTVLQELEPAGGEAALDADGKRFAGQARDLVALADRKTQLKQLLQALARSCAARDVEGCRAALRDIAALGKLEMSDEARALRSRAEKLVRTADAAAAEAAAAAGEPPAPEGGPPAPDESGTPGGEGKENGAPEGDSGGDGGAGAGSEAGS